jgi:hypothetical protein
MCCPANTRGVSWATDDHAQTADHEHNGDHPMPPNKGSNMNEEATTGTDDSDDTEGNCFKYRDGQPAGRPDDTQGHSVNSGRVQPARDDTEGHTAKSGHIQPAGDDDTEGHSVKAGHLQAEADDTEGHSANAGRGQHNPG